MKASEMKETVKMAIRHPEDMPPLFVWGGPGIGKSSVMRQAAGEEDVSFIDIRMLLLDPTDLRGIPIPDNGKAKWLSPSFLPSEGKGLINWDELNRAPVLVQNSCLQLLLDRKLGEYVLPGGYYQVACGNREMEAFVHRMDPALLNRFLHVDFDVDVEEWTKWAIANSLDPRVIGLISAFRPTLLYQFEPQKKAFPTPRSWEFVSKVMGLGLSDLLTTELIKGSVGEGATIELNTYLKIWSELPNLDKILQGDDLIPESIDLIYACCVGLVSKANTSAHYDRLLKYALNLEREFTVFLVKMLFNKDRNKCVKSQSWPELSKVLVSDEKILS